MPDRIVGMTYLCCAAATGGSIELRKVEPGHLTAGIACLKEAGCEVLAETDRIKLTAPNRLRAVTEITTLPYPGFPTDAQSLFLAMLTTAEGTSIIKETIFESRFKPAEELARMGADITVGGRIAVVRGVSKLSGALVSAADLRGGASLVIAGLAADGVTQIDSPEFIDRGYWEFENTLSSLGAKIRRVEN
jgi:UDP-N-acetylglucosamine 1-carboxyvinyltransferase